MHESSISSAKIATGMFMLFFSSLLLPTFYLPFSLLYFILMHFISFHFPFMRVTSMSFHYLFISFHCPYMSCPKSSQIEYSECVTVVTMVVTLYMCEYWKKQIHTYKSISFRVRAISLSFLFTFLSCVSMFLPCSFHFRQSYLCFTFTLFNFPPFLLFFSCPSDVPVISPSVRLIFFLIFLSCPFHFTLLSLQFPSFFPSSHSIFLVCPIIF